MSINPLSMISLEFDRARLAALGRSFGVPLHAVDDGYLVHCAARALFGDTAPQPFALRPSRGRNLRALGYSVASADDLRAHAHTFAEPIAYAACNLESIVGKPMPAAWRLGTKLGFEVRACPVSRSDGATTRVADPAVRPRAEVDCFLSACRRAGESARVVREEIYLQWLHRELDRGGAAKLVSGRMLSFRRVRLSRSTHAGVRAIKVCERPDAIFAGILEVADPQAFDTLLRRGVGRHRAFGFGMLLLRPVGHLDA
ncbi:MAG: type I-E CRISPR-associated protein Cas6/Cse3/CasE [Candidatus Binatus sp.]|nr:type I-E CRISPR-associated protein Cas6/Cse3/CasE [Candidatus Binatus sp.]